MRFRNMQALSSMWLKLTLHLGLPQILPCINSHLRRFLLMMYNVSLLTMGLSSQWKMLGKSMSHSKMGCYNLSVRFNCEWTPVLEMSGVQGALKRSATNPKFSSWKEANEKAWKTLSWRRSKARGVERRTLKKENYSRRRSQIMQEGMKGGFLICEKNTPGIFK